MMRNHQADAYGEPNPIETLSVQDSGDEESEDEVMNPVLPQPKKAKTSKQMVSKTIYFVNIESN